MKQSCIWRSNWIFDQLDKYHSCQAGFVSGDRDGVCRVHDGALLPGMRSARLAPAICCHCGHFVYLHYQWFVCEGVGSDANCFHVCQVRAKI